MADTKQLWSQVEQVGRSDCYHYFLECPKENLSEFVQNLDKISNLEAKVGIVEATARRNDVKPNSPESQIAYDFYKNYGQMQGADINGAVAEELGRKNLNQAYEDVTSGKIQQGTALYNATLTSVCKARSQSMEKTDNKTYFGCDDKLLNNSARDKLYSCAVSTGNTNAVAQLVNGGYEDSFAKHAVKDCTEKFGPDACAGIYANIAANHNASAETLNDVYNNLKGVKSLYNVASSVDGFAQNPNAPAEIHNACINFDFNYTSSKGGITQQVAKVTKNPDVLDTCLAAADYLAKSAKNDTAAKESNRWPILKNALENPNLTEAQFEQIKQADKNRGLQDGYNGYGIGYNSFSDQLNKVTKSKESSKMAMAMSRGVNEGGR